MDKRILLIDINPSALLICDAYGEPVWPIFNTDELDIIESVCNLRDIQIEKVHGRSLDKVNAYGSKEEVVYFEDDGFESDAILYAHLTKRTARKLNDIDELLGCQMLAVLVVDYTRLTNDLMEILYLTKPYTIAPGLIIVYHKHDVRNIVLSYSVKAAFHGTLNDAINYFPILPSYNIMYKNRSVTTITEKSTPTEKKMTLSRKSGVLNIHSHSNGIDLYLGDNYVLCPMDKRNKSADENRSPTCFCTNVCDRLGLSMDELLKSNHVICPGDIHADILILNICWGVLLDKGNVARVLDGLWGLMPRLSVSDSIGAIITSWQLIYSSPLVVESLFLDVLNGMTIGNAVARFQGDRKSWNNGVYLCIIGDPRVAIATPEFNAYHDRDADHFQPKINFVDFDSSFFSNQEEVVCEGLSDVRKRINFILGCLNNLVLTRSLSSNELKSILDITENANNYLKDCEDRTDDADKSEFRAIIWNNVMDYLTQCRFDLPAAWMKLLRSSTLVVPRPPCPICSQPLNSYNCHFHASDFPHRSLVFCPECGPVMDVPLGSSNYITISGRNVCLGKKFDTNSTMGSLTLRVPGEKCPDFISYPWSRDNDGTLSNEFHLPKVFPPGPFALVATFISDWNIYQLYHRYRDILYYD